MCPLWVLPCGLGSRSYVDELTRACETPREAAVNEFEPVVFVVNDDSDVHRSLGELFRSAGIDAQFFGSAQQLLGTEGPDRPVPRCSWSWPSRIGYLKP